MLLGMNMMNNEWLGYGAGVWIWWIMNDLLGYGAGYGSITYTAIGELLSPEDKSLGSAIVVSTRMIVTTAALKV